MYCPCSTCWSKTPNDEVSSKNDEEPRIPETSVNDQSNIIESKPRSNNFDITKPKPAKMGSCDNITIDPPIGISSKKRLHLREFGSTHHHHHRLTHLHGKQHQITEEQRKQTILSDWGDVYHDLESVRFSNPIRSIQRSADLSFFSETEWARSRGQTTVPAGAKMPLPSGNVMAMQLVKGGQCFKLVNLDKPLQEVVDNFLSVNSDGVELPVSFTESEDTRPKLMKQNRMAMTVRENLGPSFDPETQGLIFTVGPLNSKLCHKMTVCDLVQLQKIFSLTHGTNCETLTIGKCDSLNLEHLDEERVLKST